MKKYTKPSIEVVELSVRESLSALPTGFKAGGLSVGKKLGTEKYNNVTFYKKTSELKNG